MAESALDGVTRSLNFARRVSSSSEGSSALRGSGGGPLDPPLLVAFVGVETFMVQVFRCGLKHLCLLTKCTMLKASVSIDRECKL